MIVPYLGLWPTWRPYWPLWGIKDYHALKNLSYPEHSTKSNCGATLDHREGLRPAGVTYFPATRGRQYSQSEVTWAQALVLCRTCLPGPATGVGASTYRNTPEKEFHTILWWQSVQALLPSSQLCRLFITTFLIRGHAAMPNVTWSTHGHASHYLKNKKFGLMGYQDGVCTNGGPPGFVLSWSLLSISMSRPFNCLASGLPY